MILPDSPGARTALAGVPGASDAAGVDQFAYAAVDLAAPQVPERFGVRPLVRG